MNAISQLSSIVINRAQQAESRIREAIRHDVREVQEIVNRRPATPRFEAAYKLDISRAGMEKSLGRA